MTVSGIKAANTNVTWNGKVGTYYGMTITILTDSDDNVIGLNFNGTATNFMYFNLHNNVNWNGSYIISGTPNAAFGNFYQRIYYSDGTDVGITVNDVTITPSNKMGRLQFVWANGTVFNNYKYYPMIRLSSVSDSTFAPYTNICPISGRTGTAVITRNEDSTESNTATLSFGQTVYGGTVDFKTGKVAVEWGYIASYNGETLPGEWISDRDEYASGTTPTTGAEVAYKLATPTELTLTPQQLTLLKGYNYISADGVMDITFVAKNLPSTPTTDGTYKLIVTVANGVPSFSWVAN